VPGSETLPVTGGTPILIASSVLSPPPAAIVIIGAVPIVLAPIQLTPAKANIAVTGGTATLVIGVYTAPIPTTRDTLTVRREERNLVVSGSRSHIVNRASRSTEA
jgi:hypothetical protein